MEDFITPQFRRQLARGKYSKWAKDIDEDTLYFLLWFVGEYGVRSGVKSDTRNRLDSFALDRRQFALETIAKIQRGRRFFGKLRSVQKYFAEEF